MPIELPPLPRLFQYLYARYATDYPSTLSPEGIKQRLIDIAAFELWSRDWFSSEQVSAATIAEIVDVPLSVAKHIYSFYDRQEYPGELISMWPHLVIDARDKPVNPIQCCQLLAVISYVDGAVVSIGSELNRDALSNDADGSQDQPVELTETMLLQLVLQRGHAILEPLTSHSTDEFHDNCLEGDRFFRPDVVEKLQNLVETQVDILEALSDDPAILRDLADCRKLARWYHRLFARATPEDLSANPPEPLE